MTNKYHFIAVLTLLPIAWISNQLSATDPASHAETSTASPEILATIKAHYVRPTDIPTPEDNPLTEAKVSLGQALFFDPRLSGSNAISCASCHNPGFAWEDIRATSLGDSATVLGRHTPTILNMAWGELYFWDGRAESLEEQALGPIQSEVEMAQDLPSLIMELNAIPGYVNAFEEAFPGVGITEDTLAKAIASFERTVISGESPFDKWVSGDENAISDSAKKGFELFNGKARCSACHSGWNFTDWSFHDIGLESADIGRYGILDFDSLRHAFKTPGLRNIVERAPYMHDGSIATLEAVIDHYNDGFVKRDSLSTEMAELGLTSKEKADLLAFLKSLSSDDKPVNLALFP